MRTFHPPSSAPPNPSRGCPHAPPQGLQLHETASLLPHPRRHPRPRLSTPPASSRRFPYPTRELPSQASPHQQARPRKIPLPPPAPAQPSRLVPMGRRSLRKSQTRKQTRPPQHRLQHLPLVPRHGTRKLRKRRRRRRHQRKIHRHQTRPRRTPGHRPHLHDRHAGRRTRRRLAPQCLPHPRPPTILRRYLFPQRPLHRHPQPRRQTLEGKPKGTHRRRRKPHPRAPETHGGSHRPGTNRTPRPRHPGRHRSRLHGHLRPSRRRLGQSPQVPPAPGPRPPPPRLKTHRRLRHAGPGPPNLPPHGRRRHLRPRRRRLRPLLRRRPVARPAFRKNALRQRPAPRTLPRRRTR